MIPPIYILITASFPDVKSRAKYFGVVSGAAGLGSAAGPLIGGLVTSAISWRVSFGLQVLVVAWFALLARKITDPGRPGPRPRFDLAGAVLAAAGLFFVVLGLLQSRTYGFLVSRQAFKIGGTVVIPKGSISPVWLFVAIGALFLLSFFVVSVYLQEVNHYNAVQTGLLLTPATVGPSVAVVAACFSCGG